VFKKPILSIIGFLCVIFVSAQKLTPTVVASGGGSKTISGYTISYTIGETCVSTFKTQNIVFTEGFHQTHPIVRRDSASELTALPNPVSSRNQNILRISFVINENVSSYLVSIFNINGRKVYMRNYDNLLKGEYREIDFSNFALGMYLVKVQSKNGKILRTFKIEKL
jgi:hypothetical protein